MMKKQLYIVVLSILLSLELISDSERPNIVLIMADDMGYECLGVNGCESYETPRLDRLAEDGVRFTNCFANPLCTPSRNKMMTGQYNNRNYISFGSLERSEPTFGNQLQKAGYKTVIAGKWQLGREEDAPKHFGFDESCLWQHTRGRTREGPDGYTDTRYPNPCLEVNGGERNFVDGEYGPDVCTQFIMDFISRNKETPFFVYYPMLLTHCPFEPTPDSADWDASSMGSATYKGKPQYMADMVHYADKVVGKLLDHLEALGLRENTLFIFTCDNGTDPAITNTRWNGTLVPGGKGTVFDSGTRVPLIMDWPRVVNSGTVYDALIDFTDFFPSVIEVSGASLPENEVIDGRSFIPLISQKTYTPREWVHIWYGGYTVVRNQTFGVVWNRNGEGTAYKFPTPFVHEEFNRKQFGEREMLLERKFSETKNRIAASRTLEMESLSKTRKKQKKKGKKKSQ